ncbi:type II toxin-antitoxin system Phd/YefM family antitoxin [uncultured Amnibacterium sp.]|uniref:type II toxin-antitoxin system Phd/YefM family antitoxin n=1 Tax=uncultured Amnibacterium sp. TaxID=1631851 RepID=UPI0035CBFD20
MISISASEARRTLPAQLDRVEAGDEVSITRHGRVVAVLVRPDVAATRRRSQVWRDADHVQKLLERAAGGPLPEPAITVQRAEELVAAICDDRSAR